MKRQDKNPAPRTCATHNPGSPDCTTSCPDRLRTAAEAPGLVFLMQDGTKVGAPQDIERAQFASLERSTRNTGVGPANVDEMDEAIADIERRDDEDSDEVDEEIDDEPFDDESTADLDEVGKLIDNAPNGNPRS